MPAGFDKGNEMASTGRDQPDGQTSSLAQQIARAAGHSHQQEGTGRVPRAVAVVVRNDTVVITLYGILTRGERELASSPGGAAQVQQFHEELFRKSCGPLRKAIEKITGVKVREAATVVELANGTVAQIFTTGTIVQMYLLASQVEADSWGGSRPVVPD